jgi:hypothetical protein
VRAVEALEHFLARIEKYNPKLNVVVWLDAGRALERAKAADAALAKGEVWGPLHGVPMTIKESYNVAGSPTTWGDPKLAKRHRNERPLRYVPKFFPSLIMLLGGGGRLWLALGGWVYGTVLRRGLPGQFCAPLQLHRGLNRLDALASCSNGLTKRGLEPLIGFDQVRVVIRRGNRRL